MDKATYIWMDGKLVAWDDAKVHILTHTLHYGNGVFEGTRAYMTENGLEGAEKEERMKAGLTRIVEGLCIAFTVDAVRAEIQRYEERRAAELRPTEKARA